MLETMIIERELGSVVDHLLSLGSLPDSCFGRIHFLTVFYADELFWAYSMRGGCSAISGEDETAVRGFRLVVCL